MELNREQVIKALECCESHEGDNCPNCPYHYTVNGYNHHCREDMVTDALSLIKELTEENERLSGAVEQYEEERKYHFEMSRKRIVETKSDTVRKMQKRFIAEIEQTPNANEHFIKAWKSKIDQIAKEMIGGSNAQK